MGWRGPHLRRAAFGMGASTVFTNFGAFALYNNSPAPHLLRFWDFSSTAFIPFQFRVLQGRLTTHDVGTISPVVVSDQPPPGTIDKQDQAAAGTPMWPMNGATTSGGFPRSPYPFAVLTPGWSLVMECTTAAQTFGISFWWDWLYPDELINPNIGDPEIDY